MLRLVVVVLTACISSMSCELTIHCNKSNVSCKCKLNGNLNIVLYNYPPFLETSNQSSSLESQVDRLLKKNVLDCYNFKKCLQSKSAKKRWQKKLVIDEHELVEKIREDTNIDLVYPIPVEIYQKIQENQDQW